MMMLSCVCQAAAAEAMHVRDAVIYRRQLWLQLCALILAPLYLSLSLSLFLSLAFVNPFVGCCRRRAVSYS
jgi:hypothetical protein